MTTETADTAAALAADVIARITDHLGQPCLAGKPEGHPICGERGRCTRFYAAWFPGAVNHGISIDEYGDRTCVHAFNHNGVSAKLTYKGRLPELADLLHVARAASLLPGLTSIQDLPDRCEADEIHAEVNIVRSRTTEGQ